jgi:hypothetical protein
LCVGWPGAHELRGLAGELLHDSEVTGGTFYRTYDMISYDPGGRADGFQTAADGGPTSVSDAVSQLGDSAGCSGVEYGYPTWTDSVGANENLPLNCENWYEAYAFCIWDGGFLPSDAELEYGAAGGSEQGPYLWGSTAPGTDNSHAIYNCYYPIGSSNCMGSPALAPLSVAPVGTASSIWRAFGQVERGVDVPEDVLLDPQAEALVLDTRAVRVDVTEHELIGHVPRRLG